MLRIILMLLGFAVGANGWALSMKEPGMGVFVAGACGALAGYGVGRFLLRPRQPSQVLRRPPAWSLLILCLCGLLVVVAVNATLWNVLGFIGSTTSGKIAVKGIKGWDGEKEQRQKDTASVWATIPTAPSFWKADAHQANIELYQEVEAMFNKMEATLRESVERLEARNLQGFDNFDMRGDLDAIYVQGSKYFTAVERYARGRATLVSAALMGITVSGFWFMRRKLLGNGCPAPASPAQTPAP
jgi:hypothetical protein